MPLNELAEVAALPSGPAMCADNPAAFACAMSRRLVAAAEAPSQPFEPRLTGTSVSIARPLRAKTGPVTWPGTTPVTRANCLASAFAFARSALVRPEGRA